MKEKILFVDPSLGNSAGSQKVAINIFDCLVERYDTSLIMRRGKSQHTDLLRSHSNSYVSSVFYFPLERVIGKLIGKGSSDESKKNKFLFFIRLTFVLIVTNLFVLSMAIKLKPKFVYTYDPRGLVLSSLFLKLFGIKVVWHLHGELHYSSLMKKIIFSLVSKIIVPSEYINNQLNSNKSVVLYNGFNYSSVDFVKRKEIDNSQSVNILYVGTLVPHKGIHNIIDSLSKLSVSNQITLNVLGDFIGDYTVSYKELIMDKISNLPPNIAVNFNGWVDDPVEFYQDSDVLIFSSVKEQVINIDGKESIIKSSEALPTVLIESLAYGVPVIASNVAGVSEIVTDNVDGYIVDDSEPKLLKVSIEKFLFNKGYLKPDPLKTRNKFSFSTMKDCLYNEIEF